MILPPDDLYTEEQQLRYYQALADAERSRPWAVAGTIIAVTLVVIAFWSVVQSLLS